jgi:Fe-S cluster assembly protein SufD
VTFAELPNRRVEAWRYSDLRGTLGDARHPLRPGRDIIERLALGTQATIVASGDQQVFVERMEDESHLDARAFDLEISAGAAVTRVVIQLAGAPALSVARVRLGPGAQFRQFIFAVGAKLARIETHVSIEGEGGSVELNGVYLCAAGRHADLTSTIEHQVPNCQTRQLIKGVARKGGRGVFQGKIVVARGAQKTDARQYHHGLLLEDGAEIFAKPELLIHADDVQCAHGNTAGGLDEGALFYLRSRGVSETQARALLIEAFLVDAIPAGLPAEINEELRARIQDWLQS